MLRAESGKDSNGAGPYLEGTRVRASRVGARRLEAAGEIPLAGIRRASAILSDGVIAVSGTNGKTTTTAMIAAALRAAGVPVATNVTGANLPGGILAALLDAEPWARLAVLEVDEAWLPRLTPHLRPRTLVLTNVFRDQLDRFPDPDRVVTLLRDAATHLPPGARVLANADDARLWEGLGTAAIGYGVRGAAPAGPAGPERDAILCPRCGTSPRATGATIGHLGRLRCGACGWRSPRAAYTARLISARATEQRVRIGGRRVHLRLGGVHNTYNAVAAYATARQLGVASRTALEALRRFRPVFGRGELLRFRGAPIWLTLVKNPVGAASTLEQVAAEPRIGTLVLAINDADIDGRDPSWIWDIPLERLVERGIRVVPAGSRAFDVALRLKYAGAQMAAPEPDPLRALAAAAAGTRPGTIAVVANYTAMLEVRRALTGRRLPA